ncbi:ABC-type transport system involved in multi-copper enzyme maturation permease subunit [Pullulanibacillus pueri]|uniref:Uncharacterized protein n=1 Tax=Pullulanibacillus pueri TaxID=1437324 RepID=A0A8J2ZWD3_9BACL|nr:hypothetical protein [Pullulanibacillus pueri]MBM7680956.1 ABC-type transport system involved in multi-copper enzyme maturation permease subunit [Pullulanibacillus pueri]GGH81482.1 hypothetical protein GCM10007096_19450 [Pullulanibacillus pueri]
MQLLKYELLKIFQQKSLYVIFLFLLVFATLIADFPNVDLLKKDVYHRWEGPLTTEKVQQAEKNYQVLSKGFNLENTAFTLTDLSKLGMYEEIAVLHSTESANEKQISNIKNEHHYNSELQINMLQKVDHLNYVYNYRGPQQMIDFISFLSFLITGVMLLIGLSSIFSREYSSGVDHYILSTKKGRKALVWAKLGAALLYTLSVVSTLELYNFFITIIRIGNEGWKAPIQILFDYHRSPYAFNLLEYHLIQIGLHLLAAFGFALLILLISSVNKHALMSFFISAGIFAFPYIREFTQVQWLKTLLSFSFPYVMKVKPLFVDFQTVNVYDYPVLLPIMAGIIMLISSVIFILMIFKVMEHKQVTT